MRVSLWLAVYLLAVAALVPGVVLAAGEKTAPTVLYQSVMLTGQAETPPGDPDGSGAVTLCVHRATPKGEWADVQITFNETTHTLRNVGQPTAAHIHRGAAGAAGPVFFPIAITTTSTGTTVTPTDMSKSAIAALVNKPSRFYVNVHTKAYPNGALRGQLGPWKSVTYSDMNGQDSTDACGA